MKVKAGVVRAEHGPGARRASYGRRFLDEGVEKRGYVPAGCVVKSFGDDEDVRRVRVDDRLAALAKRPASGVGASRSVRENNLARPGGFVLPPKAGVFSVPR